MHPNLLEAQRRFYPYSLKWKKTVSTGMPTHSSFTYAHTDNRDEYYFHAVIAMCSIAHIMKPAAISASIINIMIADFHHQYQYHYNVHDHYHYH